MNILFLNSIAVAARRQRQKFDEVKLLELQESIAHNGLLHPIVVRRGEDGMAYTLVAGERRTRAIKACHDLGLPVRIGDIPVERGFYPCVDIGQLSEDAAYEAELEENVQRDDLAWQERAAATAKLMELRTIQSARRGDAPPTVKNLAEEIHGSGVGGFSTDTRNELLLSRHLDNPEVAKAKSPKEALKVLKHQEQKKKHASLAQEIGKTFSQKDHTLLQGDCRDIIKTLPDGQFDCLLTDPPYGMDADGFGNSGGRLSGSHNYDDSYDNWKKIVGEFIPELSRVMKPQAHAYVFCDFDRFHELKTEFELGGWKVFRTPFIWVNPKGMRAPWPDLGPQRKYQTCLYAVRGDRNVLRIAPDVVTFPSDINEGHAAQKPVELLRDLLARTCRPGDSVLDAFAGSGSIFPAAHSLKIKATGIEIDESFYGLASKRISELK